MNLAKLKDLGTYALDRLEEPSTWAGGGVAAILIHSTVPGSLGDKIILIGGAIFAFIAVVLPNPHNNPKLVTAPGVDLTKDPIVTQSTVPTLQPITQISTNNVVVETK